jgi:hypothetical protein
MEVLLGLKPWGKEIEMNQEVTEVCPENSKAGPKVSG